jgi:hypothetical protein
MNFYWEKKKKKKKKEKTETYFWSLYLGCFQFDPSVLILFNWIHIFLNRFQFYS